MRIKRNKKNLNKNQQRKAVITRLERKTTAKIERNEIISKRTHSIVYGSSIIIGRKKIPVIEKVYRKYSPRTKKYKRVLFLAECLRRIKCKVIPTLRIALNEKGEPIGIIMTDLRKTIIDGTKKGKKAWTDLGVEPSETVTGSILSKKAIKQIQADYEKAATIGLALGSSAWMVQNYKMNHFPTISDLDEVVIYNRKKFKAFLEKHPDLLEKAIELKIIPKKKKTKNKN